jgi:FkbM family methyltransferase
VKSLLSKLLELLFPKLAKRIRFRAIREVPLRAIKGKRLFEPELKIIKPLLREEKGLLLDVGAHVGEYCFVLEQIAEPSRIHAFEPNVKSCKTLRRFFPKILVWDMALSDMTGTAEMKVPKIKDRKYATRGTLESYSFEGEAGSEVLKIKTKTLDDFREAAGTPISFIKIDVEGHEEKMLTGGAKTIMQDRPIMLIEVEGRHHQGNVSAVFQKIEEMQYRGYFLDVAGWMFSPVSSFDPSKSQKDEEMKTVRYINNFFFLPEERFEALLPRLQKGLQG